MKHLVLVAAALAACGKGKDVDRSKHVDGVACDAEAVQALRASFDKANHDDKAVKELSGKKLAFIGCSFDMQGNDMVYFKAPAAPADERSVECHMKGGRDGLDDFRHSAMSMDPDKIKLDIEATIGLDQDKRLTLTDCEVTARDGA